MTFEKEGAVKAVESLVEFLVAADKDKASHLIDKWGAEHGFDSILMELLAPALRMVGDVWQKEEDVSLAQAYVAARIAEEALAKYSAFAGDGPSTPATKGPVVLGNVEDDCHPLGRRIVAAFLKADGWMVRDLGYDVESKTFVDEAEKIGAKVIGVSAMMYSTAENVRRVREEIDNRGLKGRVQLAVGGAVFRLRPELVEQVGGDGTAGNALGASELFGRLWNCAEREDGKADE